jgi:hypothetical protein
MAAQKTKKVPTRAYLSWTTEMDTALLDTLVEHHNNGDHAQNGWKPHVYNACIKHVKETCNVDITKDKIVGRIKTFDKHYEIISKMLAQSGFGWDSENNMVEVDSDEVWSCYVEVLNIVIKFCDYFCNLTIISNTCVLCRPTRMHLATGTRW